MKMKKWLICAVVGVGLGLGMGTAMAKPKQACCSVICNDSGCIYHCVNSPGCVGF